VNVEINEMSSETRIFDTGALKADIIAEVLKLIAEEKKFLDRQDSDRRMRSRAGDRPDEVA
jgi:hypothetical protein